MIFSLEALQAFEGDCLILHYGDAAARRFILIDGGTPPAYEKSLLPRLTALRDRFAPGGKLPLELVMCSHTDDDHIGGLVKLFRAMRDHPNDAPVTADALWFNAFDDVIGNTDASLLSLGDPDLPKLAAVAQAPTKEALVAEMKKLDGGLAKKLSDDELDRFSDTAAVLASVPNGRALRDLAKDLHLSVNAPIGGLIVSGDPRGTFVDLGDGLSFRVLAPSRQRIDTYQKEWDKALKRGKPTPADYSDNSPWNLSSLVVLATFTAANVSKTMLLTGDARGDDILAALTDAKLIKNGQCKVDLLKMMHHGSSRDTTTDFFKTVVADHYVVSADGKYGNPDLETLQMMQKSLPAGSFTLHLTNDKAPAGYDLKPQMAFLKKNNFKTDVRKAADPSLRVDLLDDASA